jgi:hypothetical protein
MNCVNDYFNGYWSHSSCYYGPAYIPTWGIKVSGLWVGLGGEVVYTQAW